MVRQEGLIALLDMDGVLCDHDRALRTDYELIKSKDDPSLKHHDKTQGYVQERIKMIRNQTGWGEKLEPLKLGFEILDLLRKFQYEIHILTKGPSSSLNAFSEKARWIEKHVGKIGEEVYMNISGDKSITYGKILVDDWAKYLEPWLENRPRGIGIMPAQEWNKDFKHERIVRYDGENIEEVKKALKWAKDREGPMLLCNINWSFLEIFGLIKSRI